MDTIDQLGTSVYKSDIKCWNTPGCQDQYTALNSKYNGDECPHLPQMEVSAPPLKMYYQALKNKTNSPRKD